MHALASLTAAVVMKDRTSLFACSTLSLQCGDGLVLYIWTSLIDKMVVRTCWSMPAWTFLRRRFSWRDTIFANNNDWCQRAINIRMMCYELLGAMYLIQSLYLSSRNPKSGYTFARETCQLGQRIEHEIHEQGDLFQSAECNRDRSRFNIAIFPSIQAKKSSWECEKTERTSKERW